MQSSKHLIQFTCLGAFILFLGMGLSAQNNVALNKRATQSSNYTSSSGQPSKAVDGNTDGRWQSGSVTHTQGGGSNNPWWTVDLGEVHDIRKIRVWNRTDCCKERLDNFVILVKNTAQESWRGFISGSQRNTGTNPLTFEGQAEGRYVMIQLRNPKGILSLAEVEVYGLPYLESVDTPNGSSITVSNEYKPATKGGQVGCGNGTFYDPIDGGTCWTCPQGYKRTVFSVKSDKACERAGGEKLVRATRHGRGGGLIGTDCPGGQFLDPNGYCYSCPQGYNRTAYPVTSDKACSQRVPADYQNAQLVNSAKTCGSGYFFDIGTNRCWSCPEGYKRTVFSVNGDKACEKISVSTN
ncbi:discoidin domain-containing protein [Phaeodactylibacter xiamenensis]|uniref:galactose-binding domain-containing protein n=1 Tax=Phaeodactylibacter xiamenensis TaxID=1524460 RepID=UPI003BA92DF2